MRQGNSTGSRETTTTLRRSPRFLEKNQRNPGDPKTPELESRQTGVSFLDLSPISSIEKGSSNKLQKLQTDKVSDKAKETHLRPRYSTRFTTWERRSTRFNGGGEDFRYLRRSPRLSQNGNVKSIGFDMPKQEGINKTERQFVPSRKSLSEIDKRVSKSSIIENKDEDATGSGKDKKGISKCISGENVGMKCKSYKGKVKKGFVLSKQQSLYKIEKRVTRSATRVSNHKGNEKSGDVWYSKSIQHVWVGRLDKGIYSIGGKAKQDVKLSKQSIRKPENGARCSCTFSPDSMVGEERREVDNEVDKKFAGVKRKKILLEEEHGNVKGWTREQQLALQRSYFAAKPTPHFWKKVAKMVPGKSAQECFDKIHSDHLTPPQAQPHSRAKKAKASSLSFSASKLLSLSESKSKKLRYRKQKSFLTHRNVRQLLQKQCNINQDNEADLFPVLEPTLDPSTQFVQDGTLFSTPECNEEGPGFLKCLEKSSSAHWKPLSQLNISHRASLISPPVLKQIKNKALHDKYIDQLHNREAKRNAESLRAAKCNEGQNDNKENQIRRREAVEAAKNALVFDARDAINNYHHLQSSIMNDLANDSPDFADSTEDEIEDGS